MVFPILMFVIGCLIPPHYSDSQQQSAEISKAEISFVFVSKDVAGTISGFQSNSRIDWDNPENSYFEGAVAVKTLDTNNGLRNWSLKGRKYFDEDDHPQIRFKSEKVASDDDKLIVKGTLTMKGVSKPMTITFQKKENTLTGRSSLYTSDFGINIKKKREDNLVKIKVVFDTN